jgi:glycosyltransferase involved in cell wall biosynthesis
MRLGILTSHPIQYNAPLFRGLAARMDVMVYYAHRQTQQQQAAAGFGVAFDWDVDLLDGYPHTFVPNRAAQPGVDRFGGCNNPDITHRIREQKFDAFLVTGWNLRCYWQAVTACRRAGIPVLVRGDSQLRTPRSTAKRVVKSITHRTMLRSFDGFLYVGQRNREYLERYGVPVERLFSSPHFVDNSWFQAHAAEERERRDAIRATCGASPKAILLLFVGKFIPEKRPEDVLEAAARLRERGHDIQLVYVGDGPLGPRLQRADAGEWVRYAGFRNQTELPAYYVAADLLVLPSASETWGLVVNEAFACGLPAVVSDAVGCAPDLIDEGRTGAIHAAADVRSLCDAIERGMYFRANPATGLAIEEKVEAYSLERAVAGVEEGVTTLSDRTCRRTTVMLGSASPRPRSGSRLS